MDNEMEDQAYMVNPGLFGVPDTKQLRQWFEAARPRDDELPPAPTNDELLLSVIEKLQDAVTRLQQRDRMVADLVAALEMLEVKVGTLAKKAE